jgi:translation initiation factor 2 subunit 3
LNVVRSFDINKPGTPAEELSGGVLGGTIFQGRFKLEDEIEIRPGIRVEEHRKVVYQPLFTKIVSLRAGGREVKEARSGGLVGIGTLLDPSLTKADGLIGNLVGKPEMLPPTLSELTLDAHLFERAVGTKELAEVDKVRMNERLLLDVGTAITAGSVTSVKDDSVTLRLARPVCAESGFRAAISRKIAGRWRLIGYGELT